MNESFAMYTQQTLGKKFSALAFGFCSAIWQNDFQINSLSYCPDPRGCTVILLSEP